MTTNSTKARPAQKATNRRPRSSEPVPRTKEPAARRSGDGATAGAPSADALRLGFRRTAKADAPVAESDATPRSLEIAIGAQVRAFRMQRGLAVTELARLADLSPGMLSKVESGQISPSLATLRSLAVALGVPVTTLFRKFEEQRDAIFVKAGGGLTIERHGATAGYTYQLLGHSIAKAIAVEPYLATLTEMSEVYPLNQHPGVEFIYVLSGSMVYRHGDKLYTMGPGDSVFFDADAPHGPEELKRVPVQMLAVLVSSRVDADDK